ncbi:MAG: hypothetical protein IT228_09510 [Flavobacteriales bacterium]|nr:hypothetical protein [Flavobacteriales bacterium]MCC6577564.1 hypothetical protein [Flavobacteriales bacterium]NUQ14656.1 hypothetical protein [Flavobacteriales bacterium]
MKHILLDTNILLDRSFQRAPANTASMEVLRRCQLGQLHGYATGWTIMTLMYLMDAARDAKGQRIWTKPLIIAETSMLLTFITVIEANNTAFANGLAMGWTDWEDAVIYAAGDAHPLVEAVVTKEKKFVARTGKLPGIKAVYPSDVL